jgi:hypothetical protein
VEVPEREGRPAQTVLITAAHFFNDAAGAECQLIARTMKADQSYERREIAIPIREHDRPLWKKHPEVDVAAIRINLPADLAIKPLSWDQLLSEQDVAEKQIRVADEIFIPGFPAKLEGNGAGWPVLRKGIIATHPLAPVKSAKTILIHANTFGGDSGAPVVKDGESAARIVGLISGMQRQTDKSSMPFEEHVTHTPLALAIVVQAPFIRETIDSLLQP